MLKKEGKPEKQRYNIHDLDQKKKTLLKIANLNLKCDKYKHEALKIIVRWNKLIKLATKKMLVYEGPLTKIRKKYNHKYGKNT